MKANVDEKIELPQGISAEFKDGILTVKGPKGQVSRTVKDQKVNIEAVGQPLRISCQKATKRELARVNSLVAHVKNIIAGVQQPYQYKLKICSGHFPMNVSVTGKMFAVKNFLGEKVPREILLKQGVTVKVAGQDIVVEAPDIELAGATASDIEQLTKVGGRDRRVFQDGIFITEKPGVKVAK